MGTPGNVDDPFSRLGPAEHVELTNLRSDLRKIVFRRACELNFGDVYSRVYFLVTQHDQAAAAMQITEQPLSLWATALEYGGLVLNVSLFALFMYATTMDQKASIAVHGGEKNDNA